MDFYRSLIADSSTRFSLLKNDLVEFNFNDTIYSLQFHPSLYNALSELELTDVMTRNIQQGVIAADGRALSVRVHKIQRHQHFDKFLFLIKPLEEHFDFEQVFLLEDIDLES
jgi:hypothetical protein